MWLERRYSMRDIANHLGHSPSTISREIGRNGSLRRYRANTADEKASDCARRPKPCRLARNGCLRRIVSLKLAQDWSPEQIAGWLKRRYPDDETIYKSLFVQSRGVPKKELQKHLRTKRPFRQSKRHNNRGARHGRIIDGISISECSASIDDRAVSGHWEGDLIAGSGNTHIVTLVERQSRFTMLVKVDSKGTKSAVAALSRQVKKLPAQLRQSLTRDRGMELANHKDVTMATDMRVYFCDPQSPWQRGSNENTNRLLRQYFPKKTDFSVHSQAELNKVAKKLNQRSRKMLAFVEPADTLNEVLQWLVEFTTPSLNNAVG